ncbi:hypothetical protein N8667_01540 [Verrucomicrobia bacterium]|nr:hypothetical protein [Verrucomicrobiota bacterium]
MKITLFKRGKTYHAKTIILDTVQTVSTLATSAVAGDVVGHDSEAMQRSYTKIDVETKRQALDKLPDLIG